MRRTGWQCGCLAVSLLACGGNLRIGQGDTDGGADAVAGRNSMVGGNANAGTGGLNAAGGNADAGKWRPNAVGGSAIVGAADGSVIAAGGSLVQGTGGTAQASAGGSATLSEAGVVARGGDTGAGGTTAVTIPWPPVRRTKIDLLFMIDNSSSMADKQLILADALPAFVNRLTSPLCLDKTTDQVTGTSVQGACPQGSEAEFGPLLDLHVGIIDSSLGAHGVEGLCVDVAGDPGSHNDDNAHLIPLVSSLVDSPFLHWATGTDPSTLPARLQDMVKGVGQHGCGYEAQLESVYRFLVDPNPPATVSMEEVLGRNVIVQSGTDTTLLSQRTQFLRPDSLVLVVLVSDEDDCSLQEFGQAYLPLAPGDATQHTPLRPGTNPCDSNPNDPCCYNCAQVTPPTGCPDPSSYSNCERDGEKIFFLTSEVPSNLRCWDQKRRYGIDFLYPVDRYIQGFREPTVTDRNGNVVENPLFADLACPPGTTGCITQPNRDPGSFLLTAVVGVPWQDLAKNPDDPSAGFRTGSALEAAWATVLGDPHASPPALPGDPLMIASVKPRTVATTSNPLGAAAVPNTNFRALPTANPINGHEWDTSKSFPQANSDLQYACTFPLPTPRDCSLQTADCDCVDYTQKGGFGPQEYQNPVCQDDRGTFGTKQYRAKAYPGLRELEVVKGLGSQGIAASICAPTTTGATSSPSYGYNPVMATILSTIRPHLPSP